MTVVLAKIFIFILITHSLSRYENASNLDKESVNKIKKKIFADTTVINVTHKPEDFDNIDNKLLIENGNILFQK